MIECLVWREHHDAFAHLLNQPALGLQDGDVRVIESSDSDNPVKPLSPNELRELSGLLDAALEFSELDRERWIRALPAYQHRVATKLRALFAAKGCAKGGGLLSKLPSLDTRVHGDIFVQAGQVIGAYRLIRELGSGGMGVVWLAEIVGDDLKRHVALKLPKLPLVPSCRDSIVREGELGAMLNHPNIARLYDAGLDSQGRPFIAMEYVDGVPIDSWCRDRHLTVRDRLKLIVKVSRTVGYVHGLSIIHRDLKPSNIFVTTDADVRLLDFGIATLVHSIAPAPEGQWRMLTPHYASPEQHMGNVATIQSDVYSLGVLAYELLTGSQPCKPNRGTLRIPERGVQRSLVAAPSSRAITRTEARQLRGEVDAIVIRAMSVVPSERYVDANEFADDIERHLASNRPGCALTFDALYPSEPESKACPLLRLLSVCSIKSFPSEAT